jgi:hypothetical protein
MVTITITYDMDDETKPLEQELQDWLHGNITVEDVRENALANHEPCPVTIAENNSPA